MGALLLCGIGCVRLQTMDRVAALQAGSVVAVLILLLMAAGSDRSIYLDVALALALLSFAGSLAFVRFMERWL